MAVLSLHAARGLSLVAVHGLLLQWLLESQSASSSERGLSSYSTQAQLLHDTWVDLCQIFPLLPTFWFLK